MKYCLEKNAGWFTWEIQPRNKSMARALGVPLYELICKKPRARKYGVLIVRTLRIIFLHRIKIIFAQNPSIVLSFLVVLIGLLSRKKVIVDAHNSGIYPLEGRSAILNRLARFIIRNSDMTIVSNQHLAKVVSAWGGVPFVLPDPIPSISHSVPMGSGENDESFVLFICTWAADEPYYEVIAAAKQIPDVSIFITGNFKNKLSTELISELPSNVRLLGFVSEEDYIHYFSSALAAIDLTTRENCLVCGAYEAAALGVPAILSESLVNRELFNEGFVYTENHADGIAHAIKKVIADRQPLKDAISRFRQKHNAFIDQQVAILRREVIEL